ncbi:fungal-specific transcription factor [Boeremia exigua]|uniref:fungal-specific transcription factor n=1 Tax=Boeremia exigua TaxID=749465 RepID=UPI001E8CAD3E|nr:fungal-specific transcription factor [Boeremia exigua]KAH6629422.1 fungal-specific transcription factor [Boeremia exigua]
MASAAKCSSHPASRAKQKHVTTACLNCRTRKIKCDAATPSCSNCHLYAQECVYQHGLDKRKVSMKDRLAAAETYARRLEELLNANGIPLPSDKILPTPLRAPGAPSSHTIPLVESAKAKSTPSATIALELTQKSLLSPSADGTTHIIDQLTGSLGSLRLAEDGQLRFYGATSNLHLLVAGIDTRQIVNARTATDRHDIQATLDAANVGQFVASELEEHLIKLYFCWEDPSIHLVQEDVFYRERRRCKSGNCMSKLYSEVLVNSMCAVGASLTSRHSVELPEPLVDFFASRARALLDVELNSPTLSTVQSLGILSGVESIRTLDARGWLYSGMAVRLATDLGLHLDNQAYVDAGILDIEEATLRRMVFWGAFIHERMWSLYLGRPVSLNETAITTPSYAVTATERKFWQPYIDEHEDHSFPALIDPIEELHRSNATLCAKMARIRDTLYSDAVVSALGSQQLHDFASSMRSELTQWHLGLPESLQVDLASTSSLYVPHVLQLHMQYHTVMIIVNRPFFAATIATLPDVAFSDLMVGRPACTDSARAIAKLLQIYRRLYGLRRINIQAVHLVFTASLIHVLNACEAADPSIRNTAWRDLEVCQQALCDLSKGYHSASRAWEVVNGIQNELLQAKRARAKRSATNESGLEYDTTDSKRHRPSTWERPLVSVMNDTVDDQQDDMILNPALNVADSFFWSEWTSLDSPKF